MTGKVVSQYTTIEIMQNGTRRIINPDNGAIGGPNIPHYTNVEVALTVTFTVAIIQVNFR